MKKNTIKFLSILILLLLPSTFTFTEEKSSRVIYPTQKIKVLWKEGDEIKINKEYLAHCSKPIKAILAFCGTLMGTGCQALEDVSTIDWEKMDYETFKILEVNEKENWTSSPEGGYLFLIYSDGVEFLK